MLSSVTVGRTKTGSLSNRSCRAQVLPPARPIAGARRASRAIVAARQDDAARMTVPGIRSAGGKKRFGKTPVLRGVDLEIAAGEFLGLAGVNGAGKTTLLKCMLDFCAVDAGTIQLFGIPPTEPRSRARPAL